MEPSTTSSRKKLFIILGAVGILLLIGIILTLILVRSKPDQPQTPQQKQTEGTFTTAIAPTAERYAGHPQYDACALLELDTVAKHTKGYEDTLKSTTRDTDGNYPDILAIEHSYIDRPIDQVQPIDASPRPTNSVLKGSQTAGDTQYVNAFTSLADSTCSYNEDGYSSGSNKGFAHVSVTQPPAPLSPDFLAYIATIAPEQKQTKDGLDIYSSTQRDGSGYFNALFVQQSRGLAIFFKAASEELLQAGRDEISQKATKEMGIFSLTYPKPYERLINPCILLSASDFEAYTGKPASTLAQEAMALTPINQALDFSDDKFPSVERRCNRLEVDRDVLKSDIARSEVKLRQFRNAEDAKSYLEALKNDNITPGTVTAIKSKVALGDGAFIKTDGIPSPTWPQREFLIQQGAALITIIVEGDKLNSDASDDVFETRMIPIAQKVLQNLKQ